MATESKQHRSYTEPSVPKQHTYCNTITTLLQHPATLLQHFRISSRIAVTGLCFIMLLFLYWISSEPSHMTFPTSITETNNSTKINFSEEISRSILRNTDTSRDLNSTSRGSMLEQEAIKRQLEIFYRNVNSSYSPPNRWEECVQPQTYYFPKINIIFTGIPKVGCSNWEVVFAEEEGIIPENHFIDDKNVESVHGWMIHKYRMPQFFKWNGIYDERIKTATSILVLRNPWVRAVSGYRQKLSAEERDGGRFTGKAVEIAAKMRNITLTRKEFKAQLNNSTFRPTFQEFVEFSVQHGIDDKHFKPQWNFMSENIVRYDYVIPLEMAGTMAPELLQTLGIKSKLYGSYEKESDPHQQSSVVRAREWFAELEPRLLAEFYHIFRYDFMLLNYSNFSSPEFPLPILTGEHAVD